MIKLIASDMDGTLLDQNSEVPPETFELIEGLYKRGVHFVASSGRRYDTLRWLFEPVADKIDYVASLGTQVYVENEVIDREVFSSASIRKLFELTSEFDCIHLVVYDRTHTYLLDDQSSFVRELDKDLPNAERVFDPPSPDVSIIKAAICCDSRARSMDMAMILEREMGDRLSFMPSGETWIDVVPRGVNKATGLEQIRRYYGISRDEIAVFGDSMNDYAMLRYAGTAYVMSNARYALKTIASKVIAPNTEQGVQKEMRRILDELS